MASRACRDRGGGPDVAGVANISSVAQQVGSTQLQQMTGLLSASAHQTVVSGCGGSSLGVSRHTRHENIRELCFAKNSPSKA